MRSKLAPPGNAASGEARGAGFHTTQWSEVVAAGSNLSPRGDEALAELCRRYWYPLYAYVRGCNNSATDAEDITQAFFLHILERNVVAQADVNRGRFRWFLLQSLRNFLRNQILWSNALKRGGGGVSVPLEAIEIERRYDAELADQRPPEEQFDLRWARSTVGLALDQLAAEYAASGRRELFGELKVGLLEGQAGDAYAQTAERLGLSVSAVKVAVHRLRQRYRELVRAAIGCSVADPADIEDEFRHLVELLAR